MLEAFITLSVVLLSWASWLGEKAVHTFSPKSKENEQQGPSELGESTGMRLAKQQGWPAETPRSCPGSAEGMEAPEREDSASEKAKVRDGEAGTEGEMGLPPQDREPSARPPPAPWGVRPSHWMCSEMCGVWHWPLAQPRAGVCFPGISIFSADSRDTCGQQDTSSLTRNRVPLRRVLGSLNPNAHSSPWNCFGSS